MSSEIQLYNGDCLIEMNKIHDHSVDLILTDPPFVGIAEDLYIKNNHLMCDIAFVNTPAGRLSKDKKS